MKVLVFGTAGCDTVQRYTQARGSQNVSCPSLAVASQGQAHFTRHPAGDDFIITPLILSYYAMICCSGQAFDIDGVLVRGEGVLPGARDSLRALEDACVPFVFVTNGGGEFGTGGCTRHYSATEVF